MTPTRRPGNPFASHPSKYPPLTLCWLLVFGFAVWQLSSRCFRGPFGDALAARLPSNPDLFPLCSISVFSFFVFPLLFLGDNNYTNAGVGFDGFLLFGGTVFQFVSFDLLDYCVPLAAVETLHPRSFPHLLPAACYLARPVSFSSSHCVSRTARCSVCLPEYPAVCCVHPNLNFLTPYN